MAMMHWMRRTSRYFLGAVVLTFIASLAYFGATQDPGGREWAVRVNGEEVPVVAYQRAHRATVEQYRQLLRERFSEELLRSVRVREQAIERLVTERLLNQRAAAEGLQVSDAELGDQISHITNFQEGGRFSRERYLRLLAGAELTPPVFEASLRSDLVRQKFQTLITEGVKVSDAEVRRYWETERQRVRAAYLLVAPDAADERAAVSDAEMEAYYKGHPAEFTPPERRRILAAILPGTGVPLPPVTDAEVEAAYQDRRGEFEQPPRARVAHILVRVPLVGGSQAEDAARAKAEAALERIRAGADFAQVAREVSEDAGSASRGGELDAVRPGELVPEFDKVIFERKPGEVVGPFRTAHGYHVVKILEVTPGSKKELKEVAATLRATLAVERQSRALQDKAQEVQQALLSASDFAGEARRLGLTVREVGPLARTDPVEGIGRVSEATEAIFGLTPNTVSGPVKVPAGYAIFRLLERQASELLPLDRARADVARAVQRQKAQDAAKAKASRLAEAMKHEEDPRALAKREGATFGEIGPFSRAEPLKDEALGQAIGPLALALADGAVGGPVPGPGGLYVVKVLGRERPDPAAFDKAEVEARLLELKRTQAWQAWLGALRAPAKIEINRKILPES
jgi:peptidyl-prolyl cis-trans isomerase D